MSNTKPNEAGAFLSGVGCLCAVPDIYNHFESDRGDCFLVDQTKEHFRFCNCSEGECLVMFQLGDICLSFSRVSGGLNA